MDQTQTPRKQTLREQLSSVAVFYAIIAPVFYFANSIIVWLT